MNTASSPQRATIPTWAWVVCLTLVAYVLSTGPVVRCFIGGPFDGAIEKVYWPLVKASEIKWVQDFFQWYIFDFWRTPFPLGMPK